MKELYIGRTKCENDVVLEDTKVSRKHHCKVVLHDNGKITIKDLGSTNGVYVDGKRISEETILKKETTVKIGNIEFKNTDVLQWFKDKEQNTIEKCNKIKQKYDRLSERYHNNLIELIKVTEINEQPFTRVFSSDDDKISFLIYY